MNLRDRTWFLSGPMTGLPEFNKPAFHAAAAALRARGCRVVNPAEFPERPGWTSEEYIRRALALESWCNGLCLLPGHETSRGSEAETDQARWLDHEIMELASLTAALDAEDAADAQASET